MNNREIQLPAIPVDFVLQQGEKEHTEAKRRPYSTLIRTWAEHEGKAEVGEKIANKLNLGKESEKLKDLRNLPNAVAPKYRTGEKAEQFVKIVRLIDDRIQNDSNWTWALTMKVMLDAVTTNLTRFFRNQPHFDALINYVIPHVLEEKKKTGNKVVKVWSAGCSTGEEPYTIAMILKDILPFPYTFQITASDLSLKSLMVGKQGFYPNARIGGIPDKYLQRFFTKTADGYQANKDLMDTIRFDYHNLKNDSGMSDWSAPTTFNTDLADDWCQLRFELTDNWGDGWNGAAIRVMDKLTGVVIATVSNTNKAVRDQAQTYTMDVPNGRGRCGDCR